MNIQSLITGSVAGEYNYQIIDKNSGMVVREGRFDNIITITGLNFLVSQHNIGVNLHKIQIGTGTNALGETSTGLTTPVATNTTLGTYGTNLDVVVGPKTYARRTWSYVFPSLPLSYTISEVATYATSGTPSPSTIFSAARVTDVNGNPTSFMLLGNDTLTPQELNISYTYYEEKIPVNTVVGSGTVTYNGNPLGYTIKTASARYVCKYPTPGDRIVGYNAAGTITIGNVTGTVISGSGTGLFTTTAVPKEYTRSYGLTLSPSQFNGTFRSVQLLATDNNLNGLIVTFNSDVTKTNIQRMNIAFTQSMVLSNALIDLTP